MEVSLVGCAREEECQDLRRFLGPMPGVIHTFASKTDDAVMTIMGLRMKGNTLFLRETTYLPQLLQTESLSRSVLEYSLSWEDRSISKRQGNINTTLLYCGRLGSKWKNTYDNKSLNIDTECEIEMHKKYNNYWGLKRDVLEVVCVNKNTPMFSMVLRVKYAEGLGMVDLDLSVDGRTMHHYELATVDAGFAQ